jgi:glutathione synthase/RimK-type ligase-like ATP-grasp enzyme
MFSSISANWLSQPTSVYNAENKILQLKFAQKVGFKIPNTIITNSKKELQTFYKDNNESIIIKPISQNRIEYKEGLSFIFTNIISEKQMEEIEEYDLTPCIFQENIIKDFEVRATVVGDKVFAAAVYSQEVEETKIDWRRKKLKFIKTTLPPEIEESCIKLVKNFNLEFGAIDLVKNKNGEYIFLEINPNGQWAWIESQTGLEISEAIINFLTN